MKTMLRKLNIQWEADVRFAVPVAQAASLPYLGLEIREAAVVADAPPTGSRRHSRFPICATGMRSAGSVAQAASLPYRGLAIRSVLRSAAATMKPLALKVPSASTYETETHHRH
jgi:hypothetical protein